MFRNSFFLASLVVCINLIGMQSPEAQEADMLARAMRAGQNVGPYTQRIEPIIKGYETEQDLETIKVSCFDQILASRKDLIDATKEFCKQNPHDEDAQIIQRWTKVVSFKMLESLYRSGTVTARNKHTAIVATPWDAAELCYIDPAYKAEYEKMRHEMQEAGCCIKLSTVFFQEQLSKIFAKAQSKIQIKVKNTPHYERMYE